MGKASRDKGCLVSGCSNKHKARGYCEMHYARLKRLGSPELPREPLENMEWRRVKGFSRYEVSEFGHVRCSTKLRTRCAGHILKGVVTGGYRRYKMVNDQGTKVSIGAHRLVALAFIGDPPGKEYQVAHGDGNSLNNHFTNLRWATPKENAQDKFKHGTVLSGEQNPRAILTSNQVMSARREYQGKYGDIARLAKKYGVAHSTMFSVISKQNWRGVQ